MRVLFYNYPKIQEFFNNQIQLALIGKLEQRGCNVYSPNSESIQKRNDQLVEEFVSSTFDDAEIEGKFYRGLKHLGKTARIIDVKAGDDGNDYIVDRLRESVLYGSINLIEATLGKEIIF